jgi:hypothetical protein
LATGEANRTSCAWCGQPIDYELTRRTPLHRMAGTADHIQELWCGGDPLDPANLAPMHRGCNTRKSNTMRRGQPRTWCATPGIGEVIVSADTDEITRLHHVIEDVLWSCEHGYLLGTMATLRGELRAKPQTFVQMTREYRNERQ